MPEATTASCSPSASHRPSAEAGDDVWLSGWGNTPRAICKVRTPRSEEGLSNFVRSGTPSLIARGNGRSYGDAAMNSSATIAMHAFDRILAFDIATGLIVCEAGVLLSAILAAILPHGWFPPVVPGTMFVSVGGMIAADVHGKNHPQAGSFAHHVAWVDIMTADGVVVRCSRTEHQALFAATFGGMGLTGIVLRAALRLEKVESALMIERTIRCGDIVETVAALETSREAPYAMAWIDLASARRPGRSVVRSAVHASGDKGRPHPPTRLDGPRVSVPAWMPPLPLNGTTISLGNRLLAATARTGERCVGVRRFFFPLDSVGGWNRLYGKQGLFQVQCALPSESATAGLKAILDATAKAERPPTLAVLKRLGAGRGMLSFPLPGCTLALDFPANRAAILFLRRLADLVVDLGGRIYLAKDAVSRAAQIERSYPGLAEFRTVRALYDPECRFASLLSKRLEL